MSVTPVPPLAVLKPYVHLANDTATFMVYDENANVDAQHVIALRELIDKKDTVSLLLWGVMTQMATLNMQISATSQQQRPDTATLMKEASGAIGTMMREMGMPMPSMPGASGPVADIRRPDQEG